VICIAIEENYYSVTCFCG